MYIFEFYSNETLCHVDLVYRKAKMFTAIGSRDTEYACDSLRYAVKVLECEIATPTDPLRALRDDALLTR